MTVNKSCLFLIVIAGMERFVFKGLACNLVTYLTDVMKMSNSSAARTVSIWSGVTSMLPLVVAPLVDSYWDHYSTILASSLLYFLGLLALVSSTLYKQNPSSSSLYSSLYLISLGQGGYNPSLQAFGANQIEPQNELPTVENNRDPNNKSWFFQWWYFGICSGSLLGVSIMPNVQDLVGWGLGFGVSAIVMVMSIGLFLCGGRFYSYRQHKTVDINVSFFQKIIRAIKGLKSSEKSRLVELELEENPLFIKEDNNGVETGCSSDQNSSNSNHLFKIMKVIIRLLPIWTTLLMFAVIFQQPATFFIKQGMTMKRSIGKSYNIPPATLQSAITISIILLMPFYDKIFIPITRFILRNDKGITTMQRIGIGMFLSVIAMVFAATVETKRREASGSGFGRLSIFYLLPQYILLGVSDIFTVVGMQEFFYSEVPEEMKTMGIALYTSVFGVGSFLSALMVFLVERFTGSEEKNGNWLSDDMRKARLDKYYWMLACTSFLAFLGFLFLCKLYKPSV
ncbi:protein NRT1/ PTR FAMILY 5.8 [Lactuca sativa]|uniref:Uncharacterized protein n=1 Tax=Lactuca sativa TaxID=4236 RepID=A0A9R1VTY2_LACSA|nr:protein NRT1/ PTR FAMILY 5.8 [Lactuca sativa]KAJ0212506.1 hypothetical protein LSAT_V11C400225980 [Lactuca sativa]